MTELRTDKELVEAVKEEFKPKSKLSFEFGKLRERVKKGELDPREVLTWYKEQPEQFSKSFVTFLKNQVVARKTKKVEKEEAKKEDKKQKGKNRKKKHEPK